jgi:hypothetical protein
MAVTEPAPKPTPPVAVRSRLGKFLGQCLLWPFRILLGIVQPIFGFGNVHVATSVYRWLWTLALINAISAYIDVQRKTVVDISVGIAVIFGLASLAQLWLVYLDLEDIDARSNVLKNDYRGWIYTKRERSLRFWIMVMLLLMVGEVLDILYPLAVKLTYVSCQQPEHRVPGWLCDLTTKKDIVDSWRDWLFVVGLLGTYALLALWNVGAIYGRHNEATPGVAKNPGDDIVGGRIWTFMIMSIISAGYWFIVVQKWDFLGVFSDIVCLVYAICALVVLLLRRDGVRQLCERKWHSIGQRFAP